MTDITSLRSVASGASRSVLLAVAVAGLSVLTLAKRADAQSSSYAPQPLFGVTLSSLPQRVTSEPEGVRPEHLRRAVVAFNTREAAGTIVIDTANTYLYYVLGQGRAIRYGVGVGREGFTWSGVHAVSRKSEWPDWIPPADMIARQPYLPRFVSGGPGNPLGARALYLGSSIYRIHGTNDPTTIGQFVSSGCIRMTNEDVIDLFDRVNIGTRVVVLPKSQRSPLDAYAAMPAHEVPPPVGRQLPALRGVTSGLY